MWYNTLIDADRLKSLVTSYGVHDAKSVLFQGFIQRQNLGGGGSPTIKWALSLGRLWDVFLRQKQNSSLILCIVVIYRASFN